MPKKRFHQRGNRPPKSKNAPNKKFQKHRPSRRHTEEYQEEELPEDGKLRSALLKARDETAQILENYHRRVNDLAEERRQYAAGIKKYSDIQLDPWQKRAFDALMTGKNVIVDAPTTAGKTRVVEAFFHEHMHDVNFRAAYTTPVKSLSNDKLREFRQTFGAENVGIATGDIKENLNAPIVVTTLETYRNSLLGVEPDLGRRLVVFDEYHFMQDEGRGSAWEEAIVLTPHQCQLLLLSASVANADEFCQWLESIHNKQCELIAVTERPVPLTDLIYIKNEWLHKDTVPERYLNKGKPKRAPMPLPHRHLAERLVKLIDMKLTPVILYAGRRLSTESLAYAIAEVIKPLEMEEREKIGKVLTKLDEELKVFSFLDQNLRRLIQVYGVAMHHSGLVPQVRLAIESLLKGGYLRFCTATMGLSIGINFSVRSALISDYRRPGESGFTNYPASEVLQMLGRAGRRGSDPVGYSLWPSLDQYLILGNPKRERCKSRLKNEPTTFLGLISRGFGLKEIESFYNKSFLRFGDKGIDLSLIRKSRLLSKVDAKDTPCTSPAHEFAMYLSKRKTEALCNNCPLLGPCHRYLRVKSEADLARLHVHLHRIGALSGVEQLTPYGEIAKYFPHAGGLLLAKLIAEGRITAERLMECAELMAAFTTARFKSPGKNERYRFPFDEPEIEKQLEELYPLRLFEELYDPPFGKRDFPVIKEFNPDAGYAIRAWIQGARWDELERIVTTEKFGSGDLMSLIYRVASYLQSMSQANIPELSKHAARLRDELLKEPLSVGI